MAQEAAKTSSGVKELIARLRDDGVQAGKKEAERVVSEARQEASRILERARSEAEELRNRTEHDIAKDREAALQALKLAQRDTVLELREGVTRHFKQHMKRLVSKASQDEELVKSLILVLAGRTASEFVRDRDAEILVSAALFDDSDADADATASAHDRARQLVLGITGDMLREGVELVPSDELAGGARVRAKGEDAEVDLSDEAVSELLMKHLLPRFRAILEGSE